MDLVQKFKGFFPEVEFAVVSGGPLRSNDPSALERARLLEQGNVLKIYENLSKNEYYNILSKSRVLFNCALQDWVSNTASEADALGTNCLYPAYRSFPETFANDENNLYIPWSMTDAMDKLENLLDKPHYNLGKLSDWTSGTIHRCIDIMLNNEDSVRYYRGTNDYRKFIPDAKY
jgi:hypothetical protein